MHAYAVLRIHIRVHIPGAYPSSPCNCNWRAGSTYSVPGSHVLKQIGIQPSTARRRTSLLLHMEIVWASMYGAF